MKPTQIQRGIQSSKARTSGEAPRIGRVSRVRGHEVPRDAWTRRRSSGRRDGTAARIVMTVARRRVLWAWSLMFTLATLAVLGGFVWSWMKSRRSAVVAVAPPVPGAERVVSRFASPSEEAALEIVRKALATRDEVKAGDFLRLGTTSAGDAVEFLKQSVAKDGSPRDFQWLGSMDADDQLIDGVMVTYPGKDKQVERLAFLVPDEKGVWKVDFEGFARISRPSWSDLIQGATEQSEVRVVVAKDAYYNGPFKDEGAWACFAMASPDTKGLLSDDEGVDILRGYCKADSPQKRAMDRILAGDQQMVRATLEIRRVEGAERRQFEITRVFSDEWVKGPQAFDERFR